VLAGNNKLITTKVRLYFPNNGGVAIEYEKKHDKAPAYLLHA
jgi:hypothetical protein